jgi:hypothetical protein
MADRKWWDIFGKYHARQATDDYFSQMDSYAKDLHAKAANAYEEAGDRPLYEIPDSVKQSLEIMKVLSNEKAPATADMPTLTELPGTSKLLDRVQTNTAGKLSSINQAGAESGASIGAMSTIGGRNDQMMEDLAIKNAQFMATQENQKAAYDTNTAWKNSQFERGNKLNYASALNQYGQFEDKQFQYNEADPYNINMNRGDAFQFAGDQAYYDNLGNRAGYANEQYQNSVDRIFQFGQMVMGFAGSAV